MLLLQLIQNTYFFCKDFFTSSNLCSKFFLTRTRFHRMELAFHLAKVGIYSIYYFALLVYFSADSY